MQRVLISFIILCTVGVTSAYAVARAINSANGTTSAYNYNYMYPYMNNQMRRDLNPGTTPELSSNPIDSVVTVRSLSAPDGTETRRRVVSRPGGTSARAASTARAMPQQSARRVVARAGNSVPMAQSSSARVASAVSATPQRSARRVVARAGTSRDTTTARGTGTSPVSSSQCFADYKQCMDGYCERADTEYNRCYCSARLAQIDSQYKPKINELTLQIARLQGANAWTDAEMNEYWMDVVGQYAGENSWENIDNALSSIDWSTTESRVRGQNAFLTGHEYCIQHLAACFYMASNLRDAYRYEIAGDCKTYEDKLQRIQTIAESVIESYSE